MCLVGDVGVCTDRVSVYRRHGANLIQGLPANFEHLVHNTESLVLPYRIALATGRMGEADLDQWRERNVARNLRRTIATLRQHHRPRLGEAVAYFNARYGDLFWSCLRLRERLSLHLLRRLEVITAPRGVHP